MKRVVVLGGSGFFGGLIAEQLRAAGVTPLLASRSRGDLRVDANNPADLRANLKTRDLVIDAAGPFQNRTPALIEAARTVGFDIIDLSDSPDYTSMIYENEVPIGAAGIRVLTACSALSTVSALILAMSGVEEPRRLTAYLVPASRYTASRGTTESMLGSFIGEQRSIDFPQPLGRRSGITVKSVDAVTLPRKFWFLRTAEFVIDTQIPLMNTMLRSPLLRRLATTYEKNALDLIHRVGPAEGLLAYEIVSTNARKFAIFTGGKTHLIAVLPAVQAALAIMGGRFAHRGVVPPTDHVVQAEFLEAVKREGITLTVS
ncbi:MAG TPA: hypothetical protein VLV78_11050 [Thermoanaerobaculia bacterium]|nr:hypothetical protein [Thermoanaerobaculia bacterium]